MKNTQDESKSDNEVPERNIFQDIGMQTSMAHEQLHTHEEEFLKTGCLCGLNCAKKFPVDDTMSSRLGCKDFDMNCDFDINT